MLRMVFFLKGSTGSSEKELSYYGTATALSVARMYLAGASVGNYALFGGGMGGVSIFTTVDAYNMSLTRSTPTALSAGRYGLAGASVGDYALFGGGFTDSFSVSGVVDAYEFS